MDDLDVGMMVEVEQGWPTERSGVCWIMVLLLDCDTLCWCISDAFCAILNHRLDLP